MNRQEQLKAIVQKQNNWRGDKTHPYVVFLNGAVLYLAENGDMKATSGAVWYTFTRAEFEQQKSELQNMTQSHDVLIRTGHDIDPICEPSDFEDEAFAELEQKLESQKTMSERYPAYFKDVSDLQELDVYATHKLFGIDDPSGAIQHASKKLLLSGMRTGGKSKYQDIKEARDALNRWLELNAE